MVSIAKRAGLRTNFRRNLASWYLSVSVFYRLVTVVFYLIYKFRKLKVPRTLEQEDERPGLRPGLSYRQEHINYTMDRLDSISQVRLFNLMMVVSETLSDPGKARILSMGPRNEVELYMLVLNGFKWSLIDAIDLVASTNKITPADFSVSLPFNDNEFDVVFASNSLSKSFDRDKTSLEIKRVLRPGGLFAVTDNDCCYTTEAGGRDFDISLKSGVVSGFPDLWHSVVGLYADGDYHKVMFARKLSSTSFEAIIEIGSS